MPIDRIAVIERQVSEGNDATAARLGRSRFQARELCRRQQRLYTGADLVRRRQSKRRRPRFGGGVARREITDGVKASRILQLPAHAKGRGQRAQLADFLDQGPQGRVRRRSLHQLGNTGGVTRRSGVLEHGCPRLGAQHFPHPCEPRRRLRIPQEPLDPARFPQPAAACPGREQQLANEVVVRRTQPALGGGVEPDLATVQDVGREHVGDRLTKHPFARAGAELLVETRAKGKAHEPWICEWNARFETVGHAHAIILVKQTRQVRRRIPVHNPVGWIRRGRCLDSVVEGRATAFARDDAVGEQFVPRLLRHRREMREVRLSPVHCAACHVRQSPPRTRFPQIVEKVAASGRALRSGGSARHAARRDLARDLEGVHERISRIPTEDLVGALPAETNLHATRSPAAHLEHRKHRGADHGLGLLEHEPRQVVGKAGAVVRGELELQAESVCRGFLKGTLVDHRRAGEMNAEAARRLPSARGIGRQGAGIDPAAEECANRNVGHQLIGDDLPELLTQLRDRVRVARAAAEFGDVPVSRMLAAATIDHDSLAWAQLANCSEERAVTERRMEVEVLVESLGVEIALQRDVESGFFGRRRPSSWK